MNRRLLHLVLSILIVATVVILASSLHDVHFQLGRPVPLDTSSPGEPPLSITETISDAPLWKILLFWLAFVINLVLFFFLVPKEVRKRILRQMISMALTAFAILMALRYRLIQIPFLKGPATQPADPAATGGANNAQVPEFQPPHMAPWWVFLSSFVVLAALLILLWLAYRWWMRPSSRWTDLDAIGDIARSSLGEIASGREWGDVIIQSYARMSEAVSTRRGLQRGAAMTPREFASRLEQAGLPAHAVARLTRLFEAARYGARASSQADVNEAVACLNSILQACGQMQ